MRRALNRLKQPRSWFQGGNKNRRNVFRTFGQLQTGECRIATLEIWTQHVLAPTVEFFRARQEHAETLTLQLQRFRAQTVAEELPVARQALGLHTPSVTEVVDADEVPEIEAKIAQAVPLTYKLDLAKLLIADGDDQVKTLIKDAQDMVSDDVERYLAKCTPDIRRFGETFGLRFDLDHWLRRQFHELTLPAKLNLAQRGPGLTPFKGYIVAAPSARSTIEQAAARVGNLVQYEFIAGEDPLAIFMRFKIVRAPVASFPKLDLIEAAYQKFREENPPGTSWSVLESTGLLAVAHEVTLMGPPLPIAATAP
jgi:hypothetical protein